MKRRARKRSFSAKVTARAEAVAKATFERRKSITEIIPPDVTRAKAARWLDLISPITEWAGMKGDALRYRRAQLRIQQEDALIRLASAVKAKTRGAKILYPLPPKILVPALEAASLEHSNSPLIDWWADLLVSGATGHPLRPYIIELMRQIGPEEAIFLENMWDKILVYHGDNVIVEMPGVLRRMAVAQAISNVVRRDGKLEREPWAEGTSKLVTELSSQLILSAEDEGVPIRLTFYLPNNAGITWPTSPILTKMKAAIDVSRALNIVQFNTHSELFTAEYGHQFRYDIQLLEFSALGIEFMKACRPNKRKAEGGKARREGKDVPGKAATRSAEN